MLDLVRQDVGGWGLVVIFWAAALEYMVPPFPADTIVLAGALLVVAGAHSFALVALVAITGGVVGAASHYALGRWWFSGTQHGRMARLMNRLAGPERMGHFFDGFKKYGLWLLVFNRALPGVRAVTFIAAGAARLPVGSTFLAGLVSNVAWTLALLGIGVTVGHNWEKIEAVFSVYKTVVYALGGTALVTYVGYRWIRRRQAPVDEG